MKLKINLIALRASRRGEAERPSAKTELNLSGPPHFFLDVSSAKPSPSPFSQGSLPPSSSNRRWKSTLNLTFSLSRRRRRRFSGGRKRGRSSGRLICFVSLSPSPALFASMFSVVELSRSALYDHLPRGRLAGRTEGRYKEGTENRSASPGTLNEGVFSLSLRGTSMSPELNTGGSQRYLRFIQAKSSAPFPGPALNSELQRLTFARLSDLLSLADFRNLRSRSFSVMPILTISYGLQYYDKAVLGSASIFGIIKDLHLSTSKTSASGAVVTSTIRYSTANAAFYWGYIVVSICFRTLKRTLTALTRI